MTSPAQVRRAVVAAAAGAALVLAAPAPALAQPPAPGIPEDLCPQDPPAAGYADHEEIAPYHRDAVDCLSLLGIARGYANGEFRPTEAVRRDEMASFLARTLSAADVDLPQPDGQPFDDLEGNPHAEAVARLAAADITRGTGGGEYRPAEPVSRAQMASFLVRSAALEAGLEVQDLQGGDSIFEDVSPGSTHGPDIEGIYELGITTGTGIRRYAPDRAVTREEMASFLVRTLDVMSERITVADWDGGGMPYTVFTWASDRGRCFELKAGQEWVSACEPAGDEPLQLRRLSMRSGDSALVGYADPAVTRVVVEPVAGDPFEVDLVPVEDGYEAFSFPRLAKDVTEVVAYADGEAVARVALGQDGMPFPASTLPDAGAGAGLSALLTDVRLGDHHTYERVVFELSQGGDAGWRARYVDRAVQQGSGRVLELDGDAILEVTLTNTSYPEPGGPDRFPVQPLDGLGAITEVHVGSTYEGYTQIFVGLEAVTPFRVFGLDDPSRVVLDTVRPS